MTERRWVAGQQLHCCGVPFRVVEGTHYPGDLVLEWAPFGHWVGVRAEVLALMVDVIAENEDHKYPHGQGGRYLLEYLTRAYQEGWRHA